MKRRDGVWLVALGGVSAALGLVLAAAPGPSPGIASQLRRVDAGSEKPSAPLSIRLVPLAVVGPNQQRVRVEVVPQADAPRLEVEVAASDGLAVTDGPTAWSAAARKGEAIGRELLLARVPVRRGQGPDERRLVVTASLEFSEEQVLGESALFVVQRKRLRPEQAHPGAREVTTPDGRRLIEMPGDGP